MAQAKRPGAWFTLRPFPNSKVTDSVVSRLKLGISGKTLTVEAISEYIKAPLYQVSAVEPGSKPKYLETNLTGIFKNANRWDVVILLDEADIFLEQRSLDVICSQFVTIF